MEIITSGGDVKRIFGGELHVLLKENLDLDLIIERNEGSFSLLNFPVANSYKVLSCFEKIDDREVLYYSNICNALLAIELRMDDFLGKMIVDIFSLLSKGDVVVCVAGLSNQSIDLLVKCFSKYMKTRCDRLLLIVIN